MLKIVWDKAEIKRIQKELEEKFNCVFLVEETDSNKATILVDEANYDKLQLVLELISYKNAQMIFQTNDGYINLMIKDIVYLESFGDDIHMHLNDKKKVIVKQPLYQLLSLLEPYHFIRISKSYIVNIAYVYYIKTTINAKLDLKLTTSKHLEVSRFYVKAFKEKLNLGGKTE